MAMFAMATLTTARLELLLHTPDLAPAHAQLLRRRLRRTARHLRRIARHLRRIACRLLRLCKLHRQPLRLRLGTCRPWPELH